MEKSLEIKEVRSNYTDDQNYIHIDVWLSDDDNEEGTKAAIVCGDTKKVFFINNRLRNNSLILEEISEILNHAVR